MLHIVNVEEIQALLLDVPRLVDRLAQREAGFADTVLVWLRQAEDVFARNRLPAAGNLAALRATLTSAAQGAVPVGITVRDRPTARKIREATASDVLRQATDMISTTVREDDARIGEATRLCSQMVAVARVSGLVTAPPAGIPRDQWLRGIWQAMAANANIGAGTVRIEGLVGPHDALVVLDRAI